MTIYHPGGFLRRVRSLRYFDGQTHLVDNFEFPIRQFDPLSGILGILLTLRKPQPSNENNDTQWIMINVNLSSTIMGSKYIGLYSFADAGEVFFIDDNTFIQGSVLNHQQTNLIMATRMVKA